MKYRLALLTAMIALGCFLLLPQSVSAAVTDTSWFDFQNPREEYVISNESQLLGLASLVNEEQYYWKPNRTESFEGVTFRLAGDITLSAPWKPIGSDSQICFCGTFDGAGHTISGLQIRAQDPYSGLFGYLCGTVKNLTVEGTVYSDADYAGGICGYLSEEGTVQYCRSRVQTIGKSNVGGICGFSKGSIYRCINEGDVSAVSMAGGIVGESRGGIVKNSGNRGSVTTNGAGSFNNGTGGVAGRSVSDSMLHRCYNTGHIISSNEATGGIVGYTNAAASSVKSCYNIGGIRITKAQILDHHVDITDSTYGDSTVLPVYAGGIAGHVGTQKLRIEDCYNTGQIRGAAYAGGIIGKCQNEIYFDQGYGFSNNYYAGGSFDGGIAADRDNERMKIRGAANEVSQSAMGHLSSSLGSDYMDDRTGEYGSKGFPVLLWQEKIDAQNDIAALSHIDPAVLGQLHEYSVRCEKAKEHGRLFLRAFNLGDIYPDTTLDKVKKLR